MSLGKCCCQRHILTGTGKNQRISKHLLEEKKKKKYETCNAGIHKSLLQAGKEADKLFQNAECDGRVTMHIHFVLM